MQPTNKNKIIIFSEFFFFLFCFIYLFYLFIGIRK